MAIGIPTEHAGWPILPLHLGQVKEKIWPQRTAILRFEQSVARAAWAGRAGAGDHVGEEGLLRRTPGKVERGSEESDDDTYRGIDLGGHGVRPTSATA